jgi:hypothetical protein
MRVGVFTFFFVTYLGTSAQSANAQSENFPKFCRLLGADRYIELVDPGPGKRRRGYTCHIVRDHQTLTSVLTLQHPRQGSDWNIIVGRNIDPIEHQVYGALDYKNNSGKTNELHWLPGGSEDHFVVISYPVTDRPSKACLIFHRFDTAEIAGQAFATATMHSALTWLFSEEGETAEQRQNRSRAIAGGLSVLQRENLAAVGYDVILNEISLQLAEMFGGGSWLFTFGVTYFGSYLENSGTYALGGEYLCHER